MRVAISTGGKPTFRILGGDHLQGCSDGTEQHFLRSGLGGGMNYYALGLSFLAFSVKSKVGLMKAKWDGTKTISA